MPSNYEKKMNSLVPDFRSAKKALSECEARVDEAALHAKASGLTLVSALNTLTSSLKHVDDVRFLSVGAEPLIPLYKHVASSFSDFIKSCAAVTKAVSGKNKALKEVLARKKAVDALIKEL